MYRSQGAMGEYFAAQAGMGEYLQAAAGMQGLGAYTSVSVSANDAGAKDRAMLVRLVQWMRNPRDPALQSALETQYHYWWKNSRGEAPSADALDRALDQAFQVWLVNKGAYDRINALSAAAASWIANRSVAGLGEFFAYTPPGGTQGMGEGEQFGRPMSAQAGTGGGIFGLGEFFVPRGVNGLGTIEGSAATPWIWAIGAGVVIGTLAVTFSKNSKLGAAGIGAAAGVAAVVAVRSVYS